MSCTIPADAAGGNPLLQRDVSERVLACVHELVSIADSSENTIRMALGKLADVFEVSSAGLAGFYAQTPVVKYSSAADGQIWPWQDAPELCKRGLAQAEVVASADNQRIFLVAGCRLAGVTWVLWLEHPDQRDWNASEQSVLSLAALALARLANEPLADNPWPVRFERRQRQEQLERVALAVGRMVHDFNNVLTGVLGFTELSLGHVPPTSPQYQYLNGVYQAAQQGAQLLQQFSLFSKRNRPRSHSCPPSRIAQEEVARCRQAWGAGVELLSELPDALPAVAIDPDSLRVILSRLLENAREALPQTGTITVASRHTELDATQCLDLFGSATPGSFVEVTVTDTGAGFSAEVQERLFREPFFSTKPRHKGLGLAGVYGLLVACKGGLGLGAGAGQGACVKVYFPVAAARPAPVPAQRAAAPAGKAERVLVVDDDPLTLQLMYTTLERAGYRVQTASDGIQALASFGKATEPFQLVLSDVVMPQMTGFELAQRLLDRDPRLNVLFTSGLIPAGYIPESFARHHFDLLPKPFRPDGLLRAVRNALGRNARGDTEALAVPMTERRFG